MSGSVGATRGGWSSDGQISAYQVIDRRGADGVDQVDRQFHQERYGEKRHHGVHAVGQLPL